MPGILKTILFGLCISLSAYAKAEPVILVVGDSISAAYGLASNQGWVKLLQLRLQQNNYKHKVVNASISGDTSHGGRMRLPQALLTHKPSIIIIELGGNDGLRGLPIKAMQANLSKMVKLSQQSGARVLLIGMDIPPNYGPIYVERFKQSYETIAREFNIALIPSLMTGFAKDRHYFQADGIHPLAKAQPMMLDTIWPTLTRLLD